MKIAFFLLTLCSLFAFAPQAEAQTRYGARTFALDTLTATDAMTFTLPPNFGDDKLEDMTTWQLRLTRIADTLTVNVYIEETIDDDASPDYVIVDTLAASLVLSATNTEAKYLSSYPVKGRKQRLRITSTGSDASAQVEVDAWWRKRVPFVNYMTH